MKNAGPDIEAGPAKAVSPKGRFFANPTFHYETLRNAGYILDNFDHLDPQVQGVHHASNFHA